MRILFYGAGVIGSLYAAKVAQLENIEVSILARGKRYEELQDKGLLIKSIKQIQAEMAKAKVISKLDKEDEYDYIIVALRKDQVVDVLPVLKENISKNILIMVNNPLGPAQWVDIIGEGRIILGFPGAGGKRENGTVNYHIVSSIIQPTTIGEIDGRITNRLKEIQQIFEKAGFKVQISTDMDNWQKTHIAMVSPMANAIYMSNGDNYTVAKNKEVIELMNKAIKEGMEFLKNQGYRVTPYKLNLLRITPIRILNFLMSMTYNTKWAETVISNHAQVARDEMRILANDFITLAQRHNCKLLVFEELAKYI